MTLPEHFLEDEEEITKKPFLVFSKYNSWLKKSYADCPSQEGKDRLQKEADRFSKIYMDCIRRLFILPEDAEEI